MRRSTLLWPLLTCGALAAASLAVSSSASRGAADDADASREGGEEGSKFLRWVPAEDDEGRLETASVSYERESDDARVTLVAAVHIADASYYELLEDRFERHDAVLYEMIKDADTDVSARSDNMLSSFQRLLRDVLELEFQLEAIDYTKDNFVHADMDPSTFFRLQHKKGESFATLLLTSMWEQMKRQAAGEGTPVHGLHVLAALASPDSAFSLKHLFARQFDEIEAMIAGIDGDGESVILSGRNGVAIERLVEQLEDGRRDIAIFYGAAHMPDLEKRVRELGFAKDDAEWVVAWDVRRRPRETAAPAFRIPWFSEGSKAPEGGPSDDGPSEEANPVPAETPAPRESEAPDTPVEDERRASAG